MVRQRNRPGQGPGKTKRSLCRKDSSGSVSEIPTRRAEGWCSSIYSHLCYECVVYFLRDTFSSLL